ncbi:protein of unknown function DUF418 [Alkaliphilus metalliredigens QYMF]|uniref:DUF418 domain-containing protein n=1 Tax=Alkaliphilus metalliredigens (strain QYMF) TaxID=293826 RepID=A6TNH6_ALKMQ|nr:DUF418 domain-containing protein [Alkaliphilus metalliredigens]ABR47744.1 protein of unknown function DUF418 [Alkaliphilus metalliredigens QYMF]
MNTSVKTDKSINHQPVKAASRIKEIDIVRGFALFGVLLVNVVYFSSITLESLTGGVTPLSNPLMLTSSLDRIFAIIIQLFGEGKFYTIFSFLFGLGFYIFIQRAEEKGLSAKHLFKRRLFILLIFGLLNLFLVWYGDILHAYALGGFILLGFRNKSIKHIKRWIIILLIISTVIATLMTASPIAIDTHFHYESYFSYNEGVTNSFNIYGSGTYFEIIKYRAVNEIPYVLIYLLFVIPKTLAMFLLGMICGKLNIFNKLDESDTFIKKGWKITGAVGLSTTIICIIFGYFYLPSLMVSSLVFGLFYEVGTVFLSLFYITSLLLLMKREVYSKILSPLQSVGRMALTNYLVQCILCSLIFYGHGLGLIGRIGIFEGVVFTLALFNLQIVTSNIWFKYYHFGPFEWVWRKLTYASS